MKKYTVSIRILLFFSVFLVGVFRSAHAALELELTQGSGNAIPIAILPFAVDATDNKVADNAKKLTALIDKDLQNSGRFNLLSIPNEAQARESVDYDFWRARKAENIITGMVKSDGNKYQIAFQLHDVYGQTVLVNQSYTITDTELRKLAHRISDVIYEKLIGIPGIFSTKIAYVLVQNLGSSNPRYSLVVADADGYNPQTLFTSNEPIMSPAWSPDGKQIAYDSFEGKRQAIYVQDVATGSRNVIAKSPGINAAPAWSHDGSKMAIVLSTSGEPKIYIFDLATKQLRAITSGESLDTEPNWGPNHAYLIFTSSRSGNAQIYKVDPVSGQVDRVTYQGKSNARGTLSADGKTLVMFHQDEDLFTIAVQDMASGQVTNLTKIGSSESPSLAPNGNMVVYATNHNGRGMLAEVSIDGKVKLYLPVQEGEVRDPAWGPCIK